MEQVDFLIVGTGPTALAAARAYRDHDGPGRVLMLGADPEPPYDRPPLSKDFLRGESEPSYLAEPEELEQKHVERRVTSVTSLDPVAHRVRTVDGPEVTYRVCLLATGSEPKRLPVPGGDDPALFTLRSLDDSRSLRAAAREATEAVVVGSGFIGCEAAVSLARLGLSVTQVSAEALPQETRLGPEAGARIAEWLRAEKVTLVAPASVTAFEVSPEGTRVVLDDGRSVTGDLVLVAVGTSPASSLASAARLDLTDGRIRTDSRMRTSAPDVLAAGDVALAHNGAAGRPLPVEHWGEALAMGEVAGTIAAGADAEWAQAPGFWSEIGDRTLKYVAWGDGFASSTLEEHGDGAFTVRYTDEAGTVVGVLTHDADDDYDQGQELVEKGSRL